MALIELLKYLVLGIVQGITEVLPVSSSGHVEIFKYILSFDFVDSIIFLIIVNTGSLFAFLFMYHKKIYKIIRDFISFLFVKSNRKQTMGNFIFALKLGIASIPAGVIGLLLEDTIDSFMLDYALLIVSVGLLLTATVLYFVTRDEPFSSRRKVLTWPDIILVGFAQSVALIPGVSRSGMTSSTALKRGVEINSTLDFSFLLYIPVSLGSLLLLIIKIVNGDTSSFQFSDMHLYFFAFFGAFFATYVTYKLIFNIFKSGKLRYFSFYCLGASAIALILYMI